MRIKLIDAGKRFNREWIFRHINLEFSHQDSYAIIGPNGSGKSTLLQMLAGIIQPSEGSIEYNLDNPVKPEDVFQLISFCAPYMEVVEEMTLAEFLEFHGGFKPFIGGMKGEEVAAIVDLKHAYHKQIRHYSSGMKQRVRLAQAILSDSPVLLLDEPCSNLDAKGVELYLSLIRKYTSGRLVVVSSNEEAEFSFCTKRVEVSAFK